MNAELEACIAEIGWVLEAQLRCLAGLEPEWLHWTPSTPGANSASAILGHTLGVTGAFVLGVIGGEPWTRHRAAEFETRFIDLADATARTAALRARLGALLAREDLNLDELVLPEEAAWGSPVEAPMSRRQILLEALRHASIHLGELRFTRSLVDAERI